MRFMELILITLVPFFWQIFLVVTPYYVRLYVNRNKIIKLFLTPYAVRSYV